MSPKLIYHLACLSLLLGLTPLLPASPVINEFMFHPTGTPAEDTREEWIELYNLSTETVDLSGRRLTKGIDHRVPEGTVLGANGFLIVAADPAIFEANHPESSATVIGGWAGRLSNDSESIRLTDDAGTVMDQLDYATQGDWATRIPSAPEFGIEGWVWQNLADGDGHTLEKRQPRVAVSSGMAWSASETEGGTPGFINSVYQKDIAPIIDGASHEPIIPRATDIITISARVTDGLDANPTVTLHYRVDGMLTWEAQTMQRDGETYKANIGPYQDEQIIEYYLEAENASEQKHSWPRLTKIPSKINGIFGVDAWRQQNNALLQVDDSYVPPCLGTRDTAALPDDHDRN